MNRVARAVPWTLDYADGSANRYRLAQASADADVRLEYVPVTPAQSSSGTYSGGAPRQARLAADDPRLAELERRVVELEAGASPSDGGRAKGSGTFTVSDPAGTRTFLVPQGAALAELDQLLHQLGGGGVA